MISSLLQKIFDAYLENYERLNDEKNCEYFKWQAAQAFTDFDFESRQDFVKRLKGLVKTCSVLIDKSSVYPFSALCKCAEHSDEDAETVRNMFLQLFADDSGDLAARQQKIDRFIRDSEILRSKIGMNGYCYANDQTSVMAYLALRDPEANYLLSTSKAKELASRVGFTDDWGTLAGFHLDTYYRFCDEIAEEIRNYSAFTEISQKRADAAEKNRSTLPLHEDKSNHLLVFDIIYCASEVPYGLGKCCPIDPELLKKIAEAQIRYEEYRKCRDKLDELAHAENRIDASLCVGSQIEHKVFGTGRITDKDSSNGFTYLTLQFDQTGKTIKVLPNAFQKGLVLLKDEKPEALKAFWLVLQKSNMIRSSYRTAEQKMESYWAYVE